jgi:hypothetical protein
MNIPNVSWKADDYRCFFYNWAPRLRGGAATFNPQRLKRIAARSKLNDADVQTRADYRATAT